MKKINLMCPFCQSLTLVSVLVEGAQYANHRCEGCQQWFKLVNTIHGAFTCKVGESAETVEKFVGEAKDDLLKKQLDTLLFALSGAKSVDEYNKIAEQICDCPNCLAARAKTAEAERLAGLKFQEGGDAILRNLETERQAEHIANLDFKEGDASALNPPAPETGSSINLGQGKLYTAEGDFIGNVSGVTLGFKGCEFNIPDFEFPDFRASDIPKTVPEILREGAATYEERNKLYGDNYKRHGDIMRALFPNGVSLDGVDDWNRFGVFSMVVSKVTRYAANLSSGGHQDSALDLMVYAAMLNELTDESEVQ